MNVNDRNMLFLKGEINRDDLWPKCVEYENNSANFRFKFGLDELPKEPGIILIRGPRQYGKSTWLELSLRDTLEDFGKGTGFFLNGDYILSPEQFEQELLNLESLFSSKAKVRRIFIDEITSVPNWEKVLKRLIDSGHLKNILIVTTGSNALDLRRGSERLPGRKGKLNRTEYRFVGVSYKDFYIQYKREIGEDIPFIYLLSGGSPLALKELWQFEKIPDYFVELIRDWITGELVKSGRNRLFLQSLMNQIFKFGCSPVGFNKISKECGFANNTVSQGYIEQLSDLMSVLPSYQFNYEKKVPELRKPCKFHFINLAVAIAFSEHYVRSIHDFHQLPNEIKAKWLEWGIAQELYRRRCVKGQNPEEIYFWKSEKNEVDFLIDNDVFIEVKLGKVNPSEFSWFPKVFPNKKLLIVCTERFETSFCKGVTLSDFLLADGLPHPYPGMTDDLNEFNNLTEFGNVTAAKINQEGK